jgi:hypothetical protein
VSTQPNPIDSSWWIVESAEVAGELITLTAGEIKYALVFSDALLAKAFLYSMNDPSLQIASLETWVMKDAFLTAAKILGATRIMFDYMRGQHSAQSAPLGGLIEAIKPKVGSCKPKVGS